jgi:N-acetylneuraminic acid mutarotase
VVLISIDGLRADAAQQADMPHLRALAERGAFTFAAQSVAPPVTLPAHAAMFTGMLPEVHGLTWNDYLPDRGTLGVPTIFSLARAAGYEVVMVAGKEKFAHFDAPGALDRYTFITNGDTGVAEQAVMEAAIGFDLLFAHFPNTDFFGHSTGWMSSAYLFGLSRTDVALGQLLAALPQDTVVVLTADHGGHGIVHGANIPEDMTIPWIIAGPGIRVGHELAQAVSLPDTAATVAHLLHLRLPPDAAGEPVLEALIEAPPQPPTLLEGAWAEGSAQQPARSEMAAAVVDGKLYVPGGFGGESVFQVYDPAADAWRDLAPLPEGRHHLAAAALGGHVYVFGGAAGGGWNPTRTAFAYDPASDAWKRLADMPEGRVGGAAVALGSKLYVVGGVGGSADLLAYDPAADAWERKAPLAQPRDHVAAAVLEGEIYALGGRWQGIGELRSIEIYDPGADAWRDGPPMPEPHAGFGAATLQGRLLIAGGEIIMTGRETQTDFSMYDPETQTWSAGPEAPFPVHGVPAAADGERFYLLGGSEVAGDIVNYGRVLIYEP